VCKCEAAKSAAPVITDPREAAQAEVIRRALERHHGNRLAAARELGMHRATLWRWLRKMGEGE
jgi:transcriptional regulator with PAS, ATPase and Fis domain